MTAIKGRRKSSAQRTIATSMTLTREFSRITEAGKRGRAGKLTRPRSNVISDIPISRNAMAEFPSPVGSGNCAVSTSFRFARFLIRLWRSEFASRFRDLLPCQSFFLRVAARVSSAIRRRLCPMLRREQKTQWTRKLLDGVAQRNFKAALGVWAGASEQSRLLGSEHAVVAESDAVNWGDRIDVQKLAGSHCSSRHRQCHSD